jgi:hypothetical protein
MKDERAKQQMLRTADEYEWLAKQVEERGREAGLDLGDKRGPVVAI